MDIDGPFFKAGISLILFYDAPTPPDGLFDAFTSIPHFTSDIKTRKYANLISSVPADNILEGQRCAYTRDKRERC